MRAVHLPEPKYLDREVDPDWREAVTGKNWFVRSPKVDRLLLDLVAVAVAGQGQNAAKCVGASLVHLTNALEYICDTEIQSVDAAVFYTVSVHPEWQQAARDFFQKNKITREQALKKRPGANIVFAIVEAYQVLRKPEPMVH
jgi:hypothetical protein